MMGNIRRDGLDASSRENRPITHHTELIAYRRSFEAAMRLYELTKLFPREEMFALTDQLRRSSRSVCTNLAEGWRKRRYRAAFVAKLNDSEAEAAETQTWIEFAVRCEHLDRTAGRELYDEYNQILAMLVDMVRNAKHWVLK